MHVRHSEYSFQREKVKQRLLKTAAELWGYQETEMEGFDPLIDLLFGACAVQFEKTAREIHSSRTRVLKRLADTLLPVALTIPVPAHAILHARPVELTHTLSAQDQFFTSHEIINQGNTATPNTKDIFFSPALPLPLVDGDIQYMAAGNKITKVTHILGRDPIMFGQDKNALDPHSLWLGIALNPGHKLLNDLTLYFDWKNQPEKANYLSLLPLTRWYVNGAPLTISSGFPKGTLEMFKRNKTPVDQLMDVSGMLEQQVLQVYQSAFVTLQEPLPVEQALMTYPEAFTKVFSSEELAQLQEPLLWLEVQFPRIMPAETVAETICAMNCFPALNRKLEGSSRPYRVNKFFNIIPLSTEDYFLTIDSVTSDDGRHYRSVSLTESGTLQSNTYAVRQEGVGRFDHRNATELLNYVLTLIREENDAFEALGGSRLTQEVKAVRQNLSRLANLVTAKGPQQDVTHYLLLEAETNQNIWVAFWSTTGTSANKIPSGKKLQAHQSADFQGSHSMLVTSSQGGKDKPSDNEKVQNFRSVLLSRNRLITEEDIKAACFAKLGDLMEEVTLKKGVRALSQPQQGLERTIDIFIHPNDDKQVSKSEWENLRQELQQFLQQKSSLLLSIQVFLKKPS